MIYIDYKDSRPLYEQISSKLADLILHGVFEPDSQLPSVRSLAVELAINPNTIQKAYADLERKGYVYSVKGKGNFVSDTTKVQEEKIMDIMMKIKELVREASLLGVEPDEIKKAVEETYTAENREKKSRE